MQLATFNDNRVGIVSGDRITDMTASIPATGTGSPMRRLIQHGAIPSIAADAESHALEHVTLLPPIPDPSKIIAAPVNYRDHQAEMNEDTQVEGLGFFLKAPSSLVGSGAKVILPYTGRRFDQEGELACVVGKRARFVSEDDALDYVFGYTAALDITMRGGEDRSLRKSFETFTPLGPWIVTADEFGSPAAADLSCTVNGTVRQKTNTSELIWSVSRLVAYASSITTLEPGDVISTGTPAGVGQIFDGDRIEVVISGLGGILTVAVSDDGSVSSPTTGHGKGPIAPGTSK